MIYDCIIIGCGPSGMTAAVYLLRAGKTVLIIEKEAIGGKSASSPLVENFPSYKKISGIELANNLYEQVTSLGGIVSFDEVENIKDGNIKEITCSLNTYQSKSLIIATGTKFRSLGLEGEEDFSGNGISYCTICDGAFYKGENVAVVGGGNSAAINALELAKMCKEVYLIVRKEHLKAEQALVNELESKENIHILYNTTTKKLVGDGSLEEIVVDNNNQEQVLRVSGLFPSIGQDPETDLIVNLANLDENKFIITDEDCQIGKGIYAVGDCRKKKIRQLTTAVSDGTIAAINAINYLDNEYKE